MSPDVSSRLDTSKVPRRVFNPHDSDDRIVMRFGSIDTAGRWCLSQIDPTDHKTMLERVHNIESMTAREAFNQGDEPGKHYDIAKCPNKDMRERLVELEYDDETQISRLRFGGLPRLFGFLRGNQFFALWWDPGHQIWPSELKHT